MDVNGPWYTLRGGWRAGVLRVVSADGLPAAFRRTAGVEEAEKLWPFTAVDEQARKSSSLTAHAVTGMLLLVLMVLAVLTEFVDL